MKAIQLTEKHKKKLLEMCKILFPELKFGFENDLADNLGMLNYHSPSTEQWHQWKLIHWFEFCMSYLTAKIDNMYDKKYIESAEKKAWAEKNYPKGLPSNWSEIWENRPYNRVWSGFNLGSPKPRNGHPIDYLYEEFLKEKE